MEQSTTFLAIDTSTAVMAGAILQQNQLLATIQTEAERNHSVHIMTNIEAMLQESGLKANDIDHYVVGIGPGSYTGVRIAVTAAKTLAWTFKRSVIKVSSLEALAYSAYIEQQEITHKKVAIIPIMDARRGQVYTACFSSDAKQKWTRNDTDQILLMEQWVEKLLTKLGQAEDSYEELWVAGDIHLHEASIAKLKEQAGIPVHAFATKMNGEALVKLGKYYANMPEARFENEDIHILAPNYAQLTEAEVKQREKEKEAKKA